MPKYAVPTPTRAVAMGSMEAASEPNARKRTTAATATPTISAVCPPDALVREMAVPPSSTSSPLASADFAASTTAWTSPLSRFSARSAKVTVAYAVRPSWLIRPDPWCAYGLSTEATPGSFSILSRARVIDCSTSAERTVPEPVCQTTVSLSPPRPGKPLFRSCVAWPDSVPGTS